MTGIAICALWNGINNALSHRGGSTPQVLVTGRDPVTPFDRIMSFKTPNETLQQMQERLPLLQFRYRGSAMKNWAVQTHSRCHRV